ncbi:MAG TPA: dihydroneopterin aldolase [Alphaproteobacteria bacterium]|jgi:dihydroneopterin aldolase
MANDPKLQAIPGGLSQPQGPSQSQTPSAKALDATPGISLSGLRRVFLRDMVLGCSIGIYRHEKDAPQRVRINLDLAVREGESPLQDDLANVVDYAEIADGIRAIVGDGHVNLVETLAERIAAFCLRDPRVASAQVRVEKLDVFTDAAGAGVEITRHRAP